MLFASVVNWVEEAEPPRCKVLARFAPAVAAAASAAPCMSRLVKYQLAASLASPANPSTPVSAKAIATAVAPERLCSTSETGDDNRRVKQRFSLISPLTMSHAEGQLFFGGGA